LHQTLDKLLAPCYDLRVSQNRVASERGSMQADKEIERKRNNKLRKRRKLVWNYHDQYDHDNYENFDFQDFQVEPRECYHAD